MEYTHHHYICSFWTEDIPEEGQDEVPVLKEGVNASEDQPTISE